MNKVMLCLSAALLVLGVSSCHKCPDNVLPVVNIIAPASGATVQLPDSVRIEGSISDDVWFNEMAIVVKASNGDTIFIQRPDVYGKKEHNFTYTYFTTTAGAFNLHISATDNEAATTTATTAFTVAP